MLPPRYSTDIECASTGAAWKTDIKDWTVNASLFPRNVATNPLASTTTSTTTVLSQTITQLIEAFVNNETPFMSWKFVDLVNKSSAAAVAANIVKGIQDAGMYNALENASITSTQLRNAASFQITASFPNKMGIYLRTQKSNGVVEYWRSNTR